jgi:hypothetical protein
MPHAPGVLSMLNEMIVLQARVAASKKDFTSAESLFIEASRPDEAVKMYKDAGMLEQAIRVAKTHRSAPGIGSNVVNELLLAQGRLVVNKKDYASAESLFIEASRPDEAVKMYKDAGMVEEALRVCKTHRSASGVGSVEVLRLEIALQQLHVKGFNDRGTNAVLLEQFDYDVDKVVDRLADPGFNIQSGSRCAGCFSGLFGGVKVASDDVGLDSLLSSARKVAAKHTAFKGTNYKSPAGVFTYNSSEAGRLVMGVQSSCM